MFVDISRSFCGFLTLASSSLFNIELPFDKAVNEVVELAKTGKVAIVIYAQSARSIHNMLGWTFEKENFENIGTTVDKFRAELSKTGNACMHEIAWRNVKANKIEVVGIT